MCDVYPKSECPLRKCPPCEYGHDIDAYRCKTCECRNLLQKISCPRGEDYQLIQVEGLSVPSPKMPIGVPFRDSFCQEGLPLKSGGREIVCGPQVNVSLCPSTHTCQLNPISNWWSCCAKTSMLSPDMLLEVVCLILLSIFSPNR